VDQTGKNLGKGGKKGNSGFCGGKKFLKEFGTNVTKEGADQDRKKAHSESRKSGGVATK